MKRYKLNDNSVVVVIGSGAGGGTLANALAKNGIDVVCLEAGKRLEFSDIVTNEAEMFGKFTWLDKRIGEGYAFAQFPVWACKTVGGTTMHWTASCPRLLEYEFKARSNYGYIEDTTLVDWPIHYSELEPYYTIAENRLGVTGTHEIERLPENNNFKVMQAGARKVGYREIDTNNMAINSKARNGRAACIQLGFCSSGCAVGAKWSALFTEIPEAEKTGYFEIRPQSMATRINHDRNGRVRSVEYIDKDGNRKTQQARVVCVAGNTVETTRLLLNSGTTKFPDGLANSSQYVGRNYMRHIITGTIGIMPGPVNIHRGTHQAGVIKDEHHHDPARGFSGGYLIETISLTPEKIAGMIKPGAWGEEISSIMQKYDHMAGVIIVGEDLPQLSNSIRLHPTEKDQYGLPVPVVHYQNHDNSMRMITHGTGKCEEIYRAVGATQVYHITSGIPATHNMGTARMGIDPKTSVCNEWGQTHDVTNLFISDGSLFPTSGAANPTLTIISLALRQADYITRQTNAGAI